MSECPSHLYVAHPEFKDELLKEIGSVKIDFGNYFLSENKNPDSIWAQDIWFEVQEIKFNSITEAVKQLKKIHSHWASDSLSHHRRAKLIQEQLNYYKHPTLDFMGDFPKQKFGCWIMVDDKTIWASKDCRSPIPFGKIIFNEDKKTPPSRAYLKLWEVFTVLKVFPNKKSRCLDLGSCPGGWSWVLSELGCDVLSVDKAPLDPKISKIKNIQFLKKDAFKLKPEEVGKIDWLFSDIICDPSRLLELIELWKASGVKNFVCTIKFKGKTDFEIIEDFKKISGSFMTHLYCNKHEITWILTQ
jgi:23S rRNA (cytidine2498-2'-O)-methyltransferase